MWRTLAFLSFCQLCIFFIVSPSVSLAQTSPLKVMTYNVEFAGDPVNGTIEMVALANYLKNNGIEVAALTEMVSIDDDCSGCDHSDEDELLDELNRIGYSMNNVFWQIHRTSSGSRTTRYYKAFLSRFPITSHTFLETQNGVGDIPTITINHTSLGSLRFFNVHPLPQTICSDSSGNSIYCPYQAVNELLPYASQFSEKKILMGDFNLAPTNADQLVYLNRILETYFEACTLQMSATCSDTARSPTDNYAVDHIFVEKNKGLYVTSSFVDQSYAHSDHFPVRATVSTSPVNTPTPTQTPSCVIQGYKQIEPIGWRDRPASTQIVTIPGITSTASQPYVVSVPGNTTHNVSVTIPYGYTVKSTLCINTTNCHGYGTSAYNAAVRDGASRSATCPAGGFADLYWHFFRLPLSGDTDGNGNIELTEWLSIYRLFYTSGTFAQGNADNNSVINAIDYNLIRSVMGQ